MIVKYIEKHMKYDQLDPFDFSIEVDCSRKTIQNILKRKHHPSFFVLKKISYVLGTDCVPLFFVGKTCHLEMMMNLERAYGERSLQSFEKQEIFFQNYLEKLEEKNDELYPEVLYFQQYKFLYQSMKKLLKKEKDWNFEEELSHFFYYFYGLDFYEKEIPELLNTIHLKIICLEREILSWSL